MRSINNIGERIRLSNLFPVEIERKRGRRKGFFLHGMVSTKDLDLAGDIVLPEAFGKHLHLYLSNPLYFLNHWLEIPIGKVHDIEVTPTGLFLKEIELDDDDPFVAEIIIPKVEKGMLAKQSIGFIPVKSHFDGERGARVFDEVILFDTSLVSIPANFHTWVSPLKSLNVPNDDIVRAYWNFIQESFQDSEIVREAVSKGFDFSTRSPAIPVSHEEILEEIDEEGSKVQHGVKDSKQRGTERNMDEVVELAESTNKKAEPEGEAKIEEDIVQKQKEPMEVQSVVCSKERFKTEEDARSWVKEHGFKTNKVDETSTSFRFRQFPPGECKEGSFRSKEVDDGVTLVLCKRGEKGLQESDLETKDLHGHPVFQLLDKRLRESFGDFDFASSRPGFFEEVKEVTFSNQEDDSTERVVSAVALLSYVSSDAQSPPPLDTFKLMDLTASVHVNSIKFKASGKHTGERVYLAFKNGVPLLPVGYRGAGDTVVPDFVCLSSTLIKILGGRGGILLSPSVKKRMVEIIADGYRVLGKKLPTSMGVDIDVLDIDDLFGLNYNSFVWYNDEVKVFEEEILLRDLEGVLNVLRKRDLSTFGEEVQRKTSFLHKLLSEFFRQNQGRLSVSLLEILASKEAKK